MKKTYWLAQTARACCNIKKVEVDENDTEFLRKYAPWAEETEEAAREHIRIYIKKYIREIDGQIENLQAEREDLVNKLFNT